MSVADQRLRFQIPDGEKLYLSSKGTGNFATPPSSSALPLVAGHEYAVSAQIQLDSGTAMLWLIEYDERERLCHHDWKLQSGSFAVRFRTHAKHRSVCLAIRIAGEGTLTIRDLAISNVESAALKLVRAKPEQSTPELLAMIGEASALVMSESSTTQDDAFDRICEAAAFRPDLVYPVLGYRALPRPDDDFEVNQLEVLWQAGRLFGLAVDAGESVSEAVLDWCKRREVPVITDEIAGPKLHVDRVIARRTELLRTKTDLRFRPLPRDAAELAEQGFEVVAPDRMPPAEFEDAKEFWAQYGVRSFYQSHKPWASLLVRMVRDLKPARILEFGCNVGRNLHAIREAVPDVELVGLDINADAIRAGREASQLDLRVGDERTLAEMRDGEFDLVFTVSVLDHMSDITGVTRSLLRVARRNALFLEVTLPIEGKVLRHYDHKHREVRPSTGASYSWDVAKYLEGAPRLRRVDRRPIYMHSASLGPYYSAYLAHLDSTDKVTMNNDRVSELYRGDLLTKRSQRICRDRIHWLRDQARGRTLDVGCSQGITSILLGRAGHEVVGIEVEEPSISFARAELAKEPPEVQQRVRFVHADANGDALAGETFDTAVMGELLEHLENPRALFLRVAKLIAPGGEIVGSTPFGLHPHPDHKQTFFYRSFLDTIAGVGAVTYLDVVDGYIRFIVSLDPNAVSIDLGPAAVLERSERAFLSIMQGDVEERQERKEAFRFSIARATKEAEAERDEARRRLEVTRSELEHLRTQLREGASKTDAEGKGSSLIGSLRKTYGRMRRRT